MPHKAIYAHSQAGNNPTMPKAALKSMSDPSGATEAKAKHIVRNDNKDKKIARAVSEKANTAEADHR